MSKSVPDSHRTFQIIGFDIMFDETGIPWLLELNSNPSLNIFLEIDKLPGDTLKEISEIDKYVKMKAAQDAISLVKKKYNVNIYMSIYIYIY